MDNLVENEKTGSTGYQSAIGVAIVAAVFSVIIAGLLVVTIYHIRVTDPVRADYLAGLREQARANPADTALAETILTLDTALRRDQFARQSFLRQGTVLLLVTLGLLVAGLIGAAGSKTHLPAPEPQGDIRAQQIKHAQQTRTALSVGVAIGCAVSLFYVLQTPKTADSPQTDNEALRYTSMEEAQTYWSTFRGPGGLGICSFEQIPETWDGASGKNILWKTAIDLPGHNSPVVWEDRIFLTGATEEAQKIYCIDAATGAIRWQQAVTIIPSSERDDMYVMEDTGYAAPTAVTDGRRVCGIFAGGDLGCFTVDGEKLWEKHLGIPDSMYGYSASLTWYEGHVIVQWDVDDEEQGSKLIALDFQTGAVRFQTDRPVPASWSSPTVVKVSGSYQVLTTAYPYVIGYDAATGTEIYYADCIEGDIASSPVLADGKIFAVEPYNKLVAINTANAQGDITQTHIAWVTEASMPDICSPVSDGVHVWTLTTQGDLSCFNVSDGSEVYTQSLDAMFQASPTIVGQTLYLLSEKGTMILAQTGREYKELKRNELGEKTFATPAFQDGRIYIRSHQNLIAVGADQ